MSSPRLPRSAAATRDPLDALDAALDAIDAPAFVIDPGGEVLHANTNGQVMLRRDRRGVSRSLAGALAGAPDTDPWDLTPLRGSGQPCGFLAILHGPRRGPIVADSLRSARARWHLTARQTEVMRLVARGLTNVLIAETLGIGLGTVEFHVSAIFDKAGASNRAMLIARLHEL